MAKHVDACLIGVLLMLGACTAEEAPESARKANRPFDDQCVSGLQLCADEGLIQAHVLLENCQPSDVCSTGPLKQEVFLEFIELDSAAGERCGPGDCGAVPSALQHGWNPGRWEIVAPAVKGLEAPGPVIIDLDAGESLEVELIYQETLSN